MLQVLIHIYIYTYTVPIENHHTHLKEFIQPEKNKIIFQLYLQILPCNSKVMKEKVTVLKINKKLNNIDRKVTIPLIGYFVEPPIPLITAIFFF